MNGGDQRARCRPTASDDHEHDSRPPLCGHTLYTSARVRGTYINVTQSCDKRLDVGDFHYQIKAGLIYRLFSKLTTELFVLKNVRK